MPFVVAVIIIQLCYPCGFLSSRSGGFPHTIRAVNSAPVQHIFSHIVSRTRGEIIALISLTLYALHSPVMQWELDVTMLFSLGFFDFTGFKDADL